MKSRDLLSSVILIGAALFVAATIFIKPGENADDLDIYAKLFDRSVTAEDAAKANATPVRVYETPKALGDRLWSILMPKEKPGRFAGTGGDLSLLRVSTGAFAGGEGNALLVSEAFRKAADGALSGTDQGIADLLEFFDAAGGNETIIAFRAQLLLEALQKDSRAADSLTALQEATKNISEAAFTALWTGYVMPANFQPDFALAPGSIGYDLGAVMLPNGEINPVYDDFIRVPANSSHVEGPSSDVETSPQLLWGDGVKGLTVFTAPIPNGTYKVYVLTSNEGGIDPSVAFGEYNTLRRDGRLRRIDLRDTHGGSRNWNEQACGCGTSLQDQLRFLSTEEQALPEAERREVVERQIRDRRCACGISRDEQERFLTDAQRALPSEQKEALLDELWRSRGCTSQQNQVQVRQPVYDPDDVPVEQRAAETGGAGGQCRKLTSAGGLATAEVLMSRQGISAEIEPEITMVSLVPDQTRGRGAVYALREEVKNGQLYIDFHQAEVPTYVVGIIVVAADETFGAQMASLVSAVLETVHPASGGNTQGPGLATNFAATTLPTGTPGGGGNGGGNAGNPGGGLPVGPDIGGDGGGDGDGDGGDGDGGGGDGDGDGDGGGGGDGDGDGGGTVSLVAEGLGPYTGMLGDPLTLDGRTSTIDGLPIGDTIPAGLLVEWLFDINGDGILDLVSTDLLANIDSAIFGSTGEFQGILRLTLDGLVSIDQVIIILFGPGAAVPEPGMLLMLALALGLLMFLAQRRRTRTA
ncbi:MAG: PEP-CTERM sorting domain-containing protein [Sphingomonadales bacterium]